MCPFLYWIITHRTAKTAKKQKNRAAEIEQSEIKHQSSVRGMEEEGAGRSDVQIYRASRGR